MFHRKRAPGVLTMEVSGMVAVVSVVGVRECLGDREWVGVGFSKLFLSVVALLVVVLFSLLPSFYILQ
jgi:hypothetical protein